MRRGSWRKRQLSRELPVSEQPSPGITGALKTIGEGLIRVLPPAFVLLIIMNILFLGMITWVFDRNAEVRNELLTKIVEKCLLQTRERQNWD